MLTRYANYFGNLIDPEAPADGPPPNTLAAFFGWILKGTWPIAVITAFFYCIGGMMEAAMMLLLGMIVDATLAGPDGFWSGNSGWLVFSVVLMIVLRPLVFGLASSFHSIAMAPNLFSQALVRLNRHTLGQSVTFFDDDFAGRIAQKQMQTARAVVDVVQEVVNAGVFATASALSMLAVTGAIDPGMALILGVWLAFYILFLRSFLPRIRLKSARRAAKRAAVTGQIVDTVTNVKTVKLFAHDDFEDRAALNSINGYRNSAIDWAGLAAFFRFSLIFLAGILPVAMLGYGLMRWSGGMVTSGELAATGAMAIRLSQMTGWVSWTLMNVYASVGEVEDGMRTLSPAHSLVDKDDAQDLPAVTGQIEFDALSFGYGRGVGGVQDLSLTIQPGEKIGIVGASGAGKSTLVAVLMRLYDSEKGRVLIDGHNIGDVTQSSLRNAIAMVTQDTAMFNRSARENILYGRPDATEAELVDAAKRAEAHEFIKDLRDHAGRQGYDAHLGERGVKLSGGQRQRIALARAILKDAPILILDEATSALDSEVEASIQAALERVMDGKTVLAIAHRLSTIARMDRIVVMDAGQIVEQGTHQDLMNAGGLYARYWDRQSGGFIGIKDAAE